MQEFFSKCCFSDKQLDAIRTLYFKYFNPLINTPYAGVGWAAIWGENTIYPTNKDLIFDPLMRIKGAIAREARLDPLWNAFSDLLPFMAQTGTITKLPAGKSMGAHIDRAQRPEAIYFPVDGCTDECISTYYDKNSQPIATYAVVENAYLTNVHKLHGVQNNSDQTRIAFGWNFKSSDMSYEECYEILHKLGYIA